MLSGRQAHAAVENGVRIQKGRIRNDRVRVYFPEFTPTPGIASTVAQGKRSGSCGSCKRLNFAGFVDWLEVVILIAMGLLTFYVREHTKAVASEEGKLDAQMRRLDDIQRTLTATTNTVERIRSDIAHFDWMRRERMTLMRGILEDAIKFAYQIQRACELRRET